jgi:FtsH-binding integral membrane protein
MYFCNAKPNSMDFKEMYHHIFQTGRQALSEPKNFWKTQNGDETSTKIFRGFILPLAVLAGIAVFLGEIITSYDLLLDYAIAKSLREMVSFILEYLISVYVLNELLTSFGGEKDKAAVSRLMAYSLLPSLIAAFITGLFPGLYVLNVLGLYGIVLFVLGAKESLGLPEENQHRYLMIAFLLIILIFMLVNVFSWKLLQAFYGYGT